MNKLEKKTPEQKPEEKIVASNKDPYIELVKLMHMEPNIERFYDLNYREKETEFPFWGVTLKDAVKTVSECRGENVSERTVWKMIQKLKNDKDPYYVAGQPLVVDVEEFRIPNKIYRKKHPEESVDRHVRYVTKNTNHPVFLQLNMAQLGCLLTVLAHEYRANNNIPFIIAENIYYQLSKYAQDRLLTLYGSRDKAVAILLNDLKDMEPDEFKTTFFSENKMGTEEDLMDAEIDWLSKKLGL